jgi:hypothetical protein
MASDITSQIFVVAMCGFTSVGVTHVMLRHEKASLSKTKTQLDQRARSTAKILPIPDTLLDDYVKRCKSACGPAKSLTNENFCER